LLHVIDVSSTGRDPINDFLTSGRELELYKADLLAKPQMVAAAKMDAVDDAERVENLREFCEGRGLEMYEISAVTGQGIDASVTALGAKVEQLRIENQVAVSGF